MTETKTKKEKVYQAAILLVKQLKKDFPDCAEIKAESYNFSNASVELKGKQSHEPVTVDLRFTGGIYSTDALAVIDDCYGDKRSYKRVTLQRNTSSENFNPKTVLNNASYNKIKDTVEKQLVLRAGQYVNEIKAAQKTNNWNDSYHKPLKAAGIKSTKSNWDDGEITVKAGDFELLLKQWNNGKECEIKSIDYTGDEYGLDLTEVKNLIAALASIKIAKKED